ncbi:MAG: type II toxin-antitoxin system Phd/YefM family antitoxin [Lautropia sp.]|nr:type II toxin-antitoxin system Phd/YefM family antitoxin [Lautropia sp.]
MGNTISAREFNQGASAVLRRALDEPVFVTNRGRIANVILSYEDYQRLLGNQPKRRLADVLATMSSVAADIDIEFSREPELDNPNRDVVFD